MYKWLDAFVMSIEAIHLSHTQSMVHLCRSKSLLGWLTLDSKQLLSTTAFHHSPFSVVRTLDLQIWFTASIKLWRNNLTDLHASLRPLAPRAVFQSASLLRSREEHPYYGSKAVIETSLADIREILKDAIDAIIFFQEHGSAHRPSHITIP